MKQKKYSNPYTFYLKWCCIFCHFIMHDYNVKSLLNMICIINICYSSSVLENSCFVFRMCNERFYLAFTVRDLCNVYLSFPRYSRYWYITYVSETPLFVHSLPKKLYFFCFHGFVYFLPENSEAAMLYCKSVSHFISFFVLFCSCATFSRETLTMLNTTRFGLNVDLHQCWPSFIVSIFTM